MTLMRALGGCRGKPRDRGAVRRSTTAGRDRPPGLPHPARPVLARATLAVLALVLLTACARTVAVSPTTAGVGGEETGLASWYGYPYHGRRTASGEVYDMNELTAAHRILPLGTRLMVTNLDNTQAVEVRVNDRGPFVEGRILDLSYGAARTLGADRAGVVRVRLRVIALPGPQPPASPTMASTGLLTVQVGAFTSRARAESLRDTVGRDGDEATVSEAEVGGEIFYRVRVGAYSDRAAAQAAAQRLAARGHRVVVLDR